MEVIDVKEIIQKPMEPAVEQAAETRTATPPSMEPIMDPSTSSLIPAVTTIITHFMSAGSCPSDSTLKTLVSLICEILNCGNITDDDHQTFQLLAAALVSQISDDQDLLQQEEILSPPLPLVATPEISSYRDHNNFIQRSPQPQSVPSTPLSNINQPVPSHNSYENHKMGQILKDSTRNITTISCLSTGTNNIINNNNNNNNNINNIECDSMDNEATNNYSFSNDELNEIIKTLILPDQHSDQVKSAENSDLPTFLNHTPGLTMASSDKYYDDHVSRRKCKLCQKVFTTKGHLTVHLREVHFKIRDFSCPFCWKAFSRSRYLRVHIQTVHRSEATPENSDPFIVTEPNHCPDQSVPTMVGTQWRIDNAPNEEVKSTFLPENEGPHYPGDNLQDSNSGKIPKNHLRHHGARRHCLFCWKFLYEFQLAYHVSRVHNTNPPPDDSQGPQMFSCSVCKTDIIQNKVLEEHIADLPCCVPSMDSSTIVQCTLCPATFTAGSIKDHYLNNHRIGNTKSKMFPSEISNYERGEFDQFEEVASPDMREVSPPQTSSHSSPHRSNWPCLFCEEVTESKETLKEHMRRIHYKNLIHKCRFCPKEYHSLRDLRSHLLLQHREHRDLSSHEDCLEEPLTPSMQTNNSAVIYSICHFCRIGMIDPDKLQQHVEKVHFCSARALFLCSLCSDTFEKASHLKHHVGAVHFNNARKPASKELPVTSAPPNVPTSMETLTKDEQCPICDKTFDSSEHFKESHTEEEIISSIKSLSSQGQGNSFIVNKMMEIFKIISQSEPDESLQKHLKFICKFCHKSFVREGHLFEHTKVVHLKVFDHVCLVCNKAFGRLRNLHAHFRAVHFDTTNSSEMSAESLSYLMGEDNQCESCNLTFTENSDLTQHIIENHLSASEGMEEVANVDNAQINISTNDVTDPIDYLNTAETPLLEKFQTELTALLDVYKKDEANSTNTNITNANTSEFSVKEEQFESPEFYRSKFAPKKRSPPQTFPCPHCQFLFKRLSHLTEHVKSVHNKIRDYACNACNSAFSRQRDLKQHLMKKHNYDSIEAALHARSQKPQDSTLLQTSLLQSSIQQSDTVTIPVPSNS